MSAQGTKDNTVSNTEQKSFEELGLCEHSLKLVRRFNWHWPTAVQSQVIPRALAGKHIVAIAPTGTGKTGAYCLPLHTLWSSGRHSLSPARPWAIILVPTRELAAQVARLLKDMFADKEHLIGLLVGGVGYAAQREALSRGLAILVATPGRLEDLAQRGEVHFEHVKYWVLDEMDRMLDFGFRHIVRRLVRRAPPESQTRVFLFSATDGESTKVVRELGVRNEEFVSISSEQKVPPTLSESVYSVGKGRKVAMAAAIIRLWNPRRTVVFVQRKNAVDEVALRLRVEGLSVVALHADYSMTARREALERFSTVKNSVLVATDIAGRGLDIRGVELVVHLDVPPTIQEYINRSGRTARAGTEGRAVIIVDKDDVRDLERLENQLGRRLPRRRLPGFDYGRTVTNVNKIKVSLTGRRLGTKAVRFSKFNATPIKRS